MALHFHIARLLVVLYLALSFTTVHGDEPGPSEWIGPEQIRNAKARPATVTIDGDRSQVVTREFHLILNPEDWDQLWRRHREGQQRQPELNGITVDYSTQMVVAIFMGRENQIAGIEIPPILYAREGASALMRYRPVWYSTGAIADEDREAAEEAAKVTPYAFVVMPKTDDVLVAEATDVVDNDGPEQTLKWRSVVTLSEKHRSDAYLHGVVERRAEGEKTPPGEAGEFFLHSGTDRFELLGSGEFMDDELEAWLDKPVAIVATPRRLAHFEIIGDRREVFTRSVFAVRQVKAAKAK